ncbi:AtzH-like domain-containing protein [uncultured Bifidobacterium sp.]|uniref:AtzH-like domain-containing protein n=1 Tax=uncultured Bifidobacterium sp. TaxID=165187 RepID=UPI0028DCC0C9|nr:AtzH-like domain-containing protein [uncultured Bifidobacterium sp.]
MVHILQSGTAVPAGMTYVPSAPGNVLWGRLPCRRDAAIAEMGGDGALIVDTVSHEGLLPDQGGDPVAYFRSHGVPREEVLEDAVEICRGMRRNPHTDGPHVVTGPIGIPGAHPGDLLAVTIVELERRVPYGVISTRHGRGVLAMERGLDGDYGQFCRVDGDAAVLSLPSGSGEVRLPVEPFLGIIGVTPDSDIRPSSIPPARYGGNIDLKELHEGATVFLPVEVEGAGLYVGDPHFAQGNGEVALTALEASLRATLRVSVVPRSDRRAHLDGVEGPFAISEGRLIVTGMHRDMDEAVRRCVHNAVELVSHLFLIPRRQAYLTLSAAADVDVTQAVDIVKGAHGIIDPSWFRDAPGYESAMRLLDPFADRSLERALDGYESALMSDDVRALDAMFADDPDDIPVVRSDSGGMRVGHQVISDFRRTRGGAPARTLRSRVVRRLGPGAACVTALFDRQAGGTVIQTQVWRRVGGRWRIVDAHLTYPRPAVDGRIWRVAGDPLIPPRKDGPLQGLGVAVKDLFAVEGFAVGAGNPQFLRESPIRSGNAWAVDKLLAAGASVRGIARTDEFAYSLAGTNIHYGTPPNPLAPGRVSGGSSSGSASAVSLGQADVGLGTDTAGSIRVPASYQGLWGIRTTHGLVAREGVLPLSESFDTVGWLTRDPRTLASVAEVLASDATTSVPDPSDAGALVVCPAMDELVADEEARAALAGWRAALRRHADVGELPVTVAMLEDWARIFGVVRGYEAWLADGAWVGRHGDSLAPDILARFQEDARITREEYDRGLRDLRRARIAVREMLGDRMLLMPTASGPAPRVARGDDEASALADARRATILLTSLAGVAGLPAVAMPGSLESGLPFGLCLVGPAGSDGSLIDASSRVWRLCGMDQRRNALNREACGGGECGMNA